jgi:hypothetical protein
MESDICIIVEIKYNVTNLFSLSIWIVNNLEVTNKTTISQTKTKLLK